MGMLADGRTWICEEKEEPWVRLKCSRVAQEGPETVGSHAHMWQTKGPRDKVMLKGRCSGQVEEEWEAPASAKREVSGGQGQRRLMERPDAVSLQIAANVPWRHLHCPMQQPHGCCCGGGGGVEPLHSAPSALPWHSLHSCRLLLLLA